MNKKWLEASQSILRWSEIYDHPRSESLSEVILNPRSGKPRAVSLKVSKKKISHSPVLPGIKACNGSQTSAVIRQPLVKAKQLHSVDNLCGHINSLSFVFLILATHSQQARFATRPSCPTTRHTIQWSTPGRSPGTPHPSGKGNVPIS